MAPKPPERVQPSLTPNDALSRLARIRIQYRHGVLRPEAFNALLEAFQFTDREGWTWSPGVRTNQWYRWDGRSWNAEDPPAELFLPPDTTIDGLQWEGVSLPAEPAPFVPGRAPVDEGPTFAASPVPDGIDRTEADGAGSGRGEAPTTGGAPSGRADSARPARDPSGRADSATPDVDPNEGAGPAEPEEASTALAGGEPDRSLGPHPAAPTPPAPPRPRFCGQCGTALKSGKRFCVQCGTPIAD